MRLFRKPDNMTVANLFQRRLILTVALAIFAVSGYAGSSLLTDVFVTPSYAEDKPAAPAPAPAAAPAVAPAPTAAPSAEHAAAPAEAGKAPAATSAPSAADKAAAEAKKKEEDNTWKPILPPKTEAKDYPVVSGFNSRITVWIIAQLHLFFGAFVLAVPIFVWIIEIVGFTSKDARYDNMAHEFMKVAMTGFSLAASFGGLLSIALVVFYPAFMAYITSVFGKVMIYYALFFFIESFFVYTYYYGWDNMQEGNLKKVHLALGLGLNLAGLGLMAMSNSWASFMMAPSGLDGEGRFMGDIWAAIRGPLWNPLNIHRFIANIAYGGSLTAAYAAFKLLTTNDPKQKAHYDWMGYTSFVICMVGLLPLPFAGYWLTKEIYGYSQQMGITLMGGAFAWLFIMQAVLIGIIFLSANYYLWCSLGRSEGSKRYTFMIQPLGIIIVIAFLMWFTPHTMIMNSWEITQIGGAHHPVLGYLGVMAAKNTAVNILIVSTFCSFQIFRRSSIKAVGDGFWAKNGTSIQVALYAAALSNIVFLGIYSYFLPASIRIGLSVPQVTSTGFVLILGTVIDMLMFKKTENVGEVKWGNMPARSQYALAILAVSFTWLMGLMGYIRSAIRQHWHVYTVFRDNSPDAFTPPLPYAAGLVSIIVVIFIALVLFMFWMPILASKKSKDGGAGASH
jgi:cytochrome bd-type quinol oxidase subunit 1